MYSIDMEMPGNGKRWLFGVLFTITCSSMAMAASYTQSGGTATLSGKTYTASSTDESGVLVTNSGVLTLSSSTVTTTGNTSSSDNSSFYGLNAGVLAKDNAEITLTNCTINTSGSGANGVFAYGTGSVEMSNDTVVCTGKYAHAIMASGGGTLTATNVNMSTAGTNSGAIATDRGGGIITVQGGTVTTSGNDSPGIYSTGTITVSNATISATASEGAVIEGLNTVTLTNTSLSGNQSTYGGVLVVQSMSGDAETGTATFSMSGGSLTAKAGPLFFVTNTDADITLAGVTLSVPSGILMQAKGTSRWGTSGSNGGYATVVASGQTLTGDFQVDSISTLDLTLKNTSQLTGAINTDNTAETASLTMDASSSWNLTGNSYLSVFSDSSAISGAAVTNITGNGYNVYYDATLSANSALGGSTYSLVNGGSLLPIGSSTTTTTKPSAAFSVSASSGSIPFSVTFTDASTPGSASITSWVWDFGDGSTSTEQNPTHTYTAVGTYSVSLTVTTSVGSDTETQSSCITATLSGTAPTASFSASVTSGMAPLTVTFTDSSDSGSSEITSWLWSFGDGGASTEQNPVHIYTSVGTYSVTLKVTSAVGSSTKTKTGYISATSIASSVSPDAAFSASSTWGTAPLSVTFTDLSTPGSAEITSRVWTFGDGSTSTDDNPVHVYTTAGIYSVSLTVTTADGSDTVTQSNYITVLAVTTYPAAAFQASTTSGSAPLSVTFTDLSTPGSSSILAWSWSFGDGETSMEQNPVHVYTSNGSFTVKLTVISSSGSNTLKKTNYITVSATSSSTYPTAAFSASSTLGIMPLSVSFTDQSSSGTAPSTSWLWSFGDGTTSTEENPTHVYTGAGSYTVSLMVTTANGSDTETKTAYITAIDASGAGCYAGYRGGMPFDALGDFLILCLISAGLWGMSYLKKAGAATVFRKNQG